MILQFSVTNHRSIKEQAVINMQATKDSTMQECLLSVDEKKKLIPVMALYGANAAGKSNVLHAIWQMREMICGRYAQLLKGEQLPQEPFAFTDKENEPTVFEVIYYYHGIKYAYGYQFDKNKIISEYLYHWPRGREALIFYRENGRYEFRENIQEQMTLAGRTPDNRLYLVASNEWNCAQTEQAYQWFQKEIYGLLDPQASVEPAVEAIRKGGKVKEKILKELLVADLGIKDIVVTGTKAEPLISAVHSFLNPEGKESQYALPMGLESRGTQRFFSRIGTWMDALEAGAVLLVDEIEASMHPLLTRHLIELVQDPKINTKQSQMIFTTHDAGLLDLSLLRRDQICFAEKNEQTMETEIYELTEFSPRKGENISKGYLQGRYGAIPFIGGGDCLEANKRARKKAVRKKT